MFQWAFLSEITLTTVVWCNNLLVDTDLEHMTKQQIEAKLYYDIVVDRENLNHWLPATIMIAEFMFNCIPFSWRHIPIILVMSTCYTAVNASYCLYFRVMIYPGVDWINDWPNALAKGQTTVAI